MNCSSIDLKAYALGEPSGGPGEASHIASCESCREELERLRLTQTALLSLVDEEVPQRIAFVSDQVFELYWWQRMWRSGPAMAFASAALLALAIFAHGFMQRGTGVQAAGITAAQIDQRVSAEVDRRVAAEVAKVVAASQAREAKVVETLEAAEKRFQLQRDADIHIMEQAAEYYQSKVGQLMVASNRSYGGAQ